MCATSAHGPNTVSSGIVEPSVRPSQPNRDRVCRMRGPPNPSIQVPADSKARTRARRAAGGGAASDSGPTQASRAFNNEPNPGSIPPQGTMLSPSSLPPDLEALLRSIMLLAVSRWSANLELQITVILTSQANSLTRKAVYSESPLGLTERGHEGSDRLGPRSPRHCRRFGVFALSRPR